jgi:RNA polymerase-binding transcription factor DksA
LGGVAAVEERPETIAPPWPFADAVEAIHAGERKELGFATRQILLARVNHLSEALDRMNEGEYGICAGCNEPISQGRLNAMPEAQTCVRCQARLERPELN